MASDSVVFRVVQVASVDYDFAAGAGAVHLREAEAPGRSLWLPVALHDATSIFQAVQRLVGRRPSSSELTALMLRELQADIIAARIVRVLEGVYYAELDVMSPRGRRVLDCRPSDAITLALRQVVPAPILVAEEILAG